MVLLDLVNYAVPTEGIHHTEDNTTLSVDGHDVGCGNLYITESCVLWLNPSDQGVHLTYKQISLHAISRDLRSFPHEHLLLHYEGSLPVVSGVNGHGERATDASQSDEDDDHGDPEDGSLIEIRFVPQNKESLESMFEAMSSCQILHPDDDCQLSEDSEFEDAEEEESNEFYTEGDDAGNLTEEGQATLQHLNNLLERGQGDGDLVARTNDMQIQNGHDDGTVPSSDTDQFQDAEDMDQ